MLVARCSLLVARCSLLVARCSLLVARCSLLVARCSLRAASLRQGSPRSLRQGSHLRAPRLSQRRQSIEAPTSVTLETLHTGDHPTAAVGGAAGSGGVGGSRARPRSGGGRELDARTAGRPSSSHRQGGAHAGLLSAHRFFRKRTSSWRLGCPWQQDPRKNRDPRGRRAPANDPPGGVPHACSPTKA